MQSVTCWRKIVIFGSGWTDFRRLVFTPIKSVCAAFGMFGVEGIMSKCPKVYVVLLGDN